MITTSVSDSGSTLTIHVKGRFDFNSATEFHNSYKDICDQHDCFIIDMEETEYIDSSALGAMLLLRDEVTDGEVSIMNAPEFAKRMFKSTLFDSLFKVE